MGRGAGELLARRATAHFSLSGARDIGRRQTKPKPRAETHRVGRRIRVREVRLIDENGQQQGIVPTADAMQRAEGLGLQLVEVNPKAQPPVCKIMDFGKFKYELSKRERETKRNQKITEVKEVKLRPKTHEHDYGFKVRHVRRFLEDGDKVKLVVQFRGREIAHPEMGRLILERVCADLVDIAQVLQAPQMEANRMNMVLGPKKSREGGGKAAKSARPAKVTTPVPADTAEEEVIDEEEYEDVEQGEDFDDEEYDDETSEEEEEQEVSST